jgi:tRNA splicing endonuclease
MRPSVQPPSLGECQEKASLLERYAAETSAYNRTVELLRSKLGTLSKAEYDELRKLTDETRLFCEVARLALYRHIREHGC